MLLLVAVLLGCSRATTPSVQSTPQPRVLSFHVTTSDGIYVAGASGQIGQPPGGTVSHPHVILHASTRDADAVGFVIGSLVGNNGPIEQLGPFQPDSSGVVEVEWALSRPAFSYIVWAEALRKPPAPPREGDIVTHLATLSLRVVPSVWNSVTGIERWTCATVGCWAPERKSTTWTSSVPACSQTPKSRRA